MDVVALRQAITATLEITGLRVYGYIPDSPNVPCLIVFPQSWTYDDSYDGTAMPTFIVMALLSSTNMEASQQLLDTWLGDDEDNTLSLPRAIQNDARLNVRGLQRYGVLQLTDGGTRYMSAELIVDALADD